MHPLGMTRESTQGFGQIQLPDEVCTGVLRGDPDCIGVAYEMLARKVKTLAARMLGDAHSAEEVVQDTFIELVEKSTQIRDPGAIGAWVKRVAVNHCLMRLRSPWHTRRMQVREEDEPAATSLEWVEGNDALARALKDLTDDARVVLWLHEVEGYTHKEIGELMGRTASFSKSQLARAYQKLLDWRQHDGAAATQEASPLKRIKHDRNTFRTKNIQAPCRS